MTVLTHPPDFPDDTPRSRAVVRQPSRAVRRNTERAVQAEQGAALVRATRVTGRAFVASVGLTHTAQLSRDEELAIQNAPLGEARYKHIVDAYAMFVAGEVGRP